MRIALFGGSFDPPHRGHLAIAAAAADSFALDQVLFAPTGRQPLKPTGAHAPYPDRLAMVALACEADPRFLPSPLDAPHADGTPNFTLTALQTLRARHPEAKLFSVIGADALQTLPFWRQPRQLLQLADWIVVSRPGYPLAYPQGLPREPIHTLETVHQDISATTLRQRLQTGDPCPGLLPPAVHRYITTHHLYR